MKSYSVLVALLTSYTALSQERILISPQDEVIPLKRGESALQVARHHGLGQRSSGECTDHFTFGFDEGRFPPNNNFGSRHKDVVADWFIAPAAGTIDTIFWESLGSVGALDSLVSVRIFKSNIYPGRGPGNAPYPPPCVPWGYYVNDHDSDRHITPFRDEATDTT